MSVLHFGDFQLDPVGKQLMRGDVEIDLRGNPFTMLCYLVESSSVDTKESQSSRLFTKDELQKYVWRGVHVSDETLRSGISAIRKALGDDPQQPRYIKTQSREGWRWLAQVKESGGRQPAQSRTLQPPDSAYDPIWYVERPDEEREILGCIGYPGRPVVLYGPQGAGKRTLIARILERATADHPKALSPHVLRISLRSFTDANLASLDSFLHELGRRMLDPNQEEDDRVFEQLAAVWSKKIEPQLKLKRIVRNSLLEQGRPVLLVLTDVDALVQWRYQAPFFDMLRAWQDADGMASLRLVVSSAIPPRLFPLSEHSPLWTKSARVSVGELSEVQVDQLARMHRLSPSSTTCRALQELVGGLALLCRQAIFRAAVRGISLEGLLQEWQHPRRPFEVFGAHLSDLEQWLEQRSKGPTKNKDWKQLMSEARNGASLTSEEAWPFVRKGLLQETERRGVYRLRCKLYEDFFLGLRP